ncbi:MAG: alpha/beta hydrolase [Clostridiales bacterium]|nr:alpha/beta hydrolase [Clostridiales bacterium]
MSKYPIKKEFFPLNHFKPPIRKWFLKITVPFIKAPRAIYKDKALETKRYHVQSADGEKIGCFLISPKGIEGKTPCLIYIHGGGFVLPAAGYHYKNAMQYAKEIGCKVWFINYRLAPKHSPSTYFDDCYFATCYLYDHAEEFGIDVNKIGIGGDSAGSALSVGVCMMARDRNHPIKFLFQMLPYPFLDMRGDSESNKQFTDTPIWNSKLSNRVRKLVKIDKNDPYYVYYSPVEMENFDGLPPAYVETAEFDCLHDDGILYAELLQKAGISVTLNETKGTIHGFDLKQKAPTTKVAIERRIQFMKDQYAK